MGGSMIKNTGATLRSAASAGSKTIQKYAPKAMEMIGATAGQAGKALKVAGPKAMTAIKTGAALAVASKGGKIAMQGGKLAVKAVKRNPMLTAAVVVAGAGAAVLIRRSKRKAAEAAAGRTGKSLTPTNRRGAAATKAAPARKATAKKAASKAPAKKVASKAAPRKRATGNGASAGVAKST
jgi:DNA-binding protein HU-beta